MNPTEPLSSSLEDAVQQIQTEFYSQSGKNLLFKKQQKMDCAAQVSAQIPIEELLKRTCCLLPDRKNTVFIDYPFLKTFATPDLFPTIVDFIISVCRIIKTANKRLRIMLNFDGFTVSAAERYKGLIQLFSATCLAQNTQFAEILDDFCILNAPSTLAHIQSAVRAFIVADIQSKIRTFSRTESAAVLEHVYEVIRNGKGLDVSVLNDEA